MHTLNLKPSDKTLKEFAEFGMFILGLVAAPWMLYRGHTTAAVVMWAMAIVLRALAFVNPHWVRWPFIALSVVTWPIGLVVSYLVLVIIYYLVFTPVAIVFRLVGRDALNRKLNSQAATYWESHNPNRGAARYFKQF
jgi:hypothetical protein